MFTHPYFSDLSVRKYFLMLPATAAKERHFFLVLLSFAKLVIKSFPGFTYIICLYIYVWMYLLRGILPNA